MTRLVGPRCLWWDSRLSSSPREATVVESGDYSGTRRHPHKDGRSDPTLDRNAAQVIKVDNYECSIYHELLSQESSGNDPRHTPRVTASFATPDPCPAKGPAAAGGSPTVVTGRPPTDDCRKPVAVVAVASIATRLPVTQPTTTTTGPAVGCSTGAGGCPDPSRACLDTEMMTRESWAGGEPWEMRGDL